MRKSSLTATLEISSWVGISIGATHSYGKIKYYDKSGELHVMDLLRVISSNGDAKCLNLIDGADDSCEFKVGDKTKRFDTNDEVIEFAKDVFKKEFIPKKYKYLILGSYTIYEPQLIIYGNDALSKKNNEMYEQFKNRDWDNRDDEPIMDKIHREWVKTVAKKLFKWE